MAKAKLIATRNITVHDEDGRRIEINAGDRVLEEWQGMMSPSVLQKFTKKATKTIVIEEGVEEEDDEPDDGLKALGVSDLKELMKINLVDLPKGTASNKKNILSGLHKLMGQFTDCCRFSDTIHTYNHNDKRTFFRHNQFSLLVRTMKKT